MGWFKKDESVSNNDWISGFQAGFRTGYDQAFTIVYDQLKKAIGFSEDKVRQQAIDSTVKNLESLVKRSE